MPVYLLYNHLISNSHSNTITDKEASGHGKVRCCFNYHYLGVIRAATGMAGVKELKYARSSLGSGVTYLVFLSMKEKSIYIKIEEIPAA